MAAPDQRREPVAVRRPDRGRAARRPAASSGPGTGRRSAPSSPRWTSAPPRRSPRSLHETVERGAARLPDRRRPPRTWPAPAPAGRRAATAGTCRRRWITPAGRRRRRAAGGHRAVHAPRDARRPAHARLHAVPGRPGCAGPRADRGADGRAGRPDGLRPRRHRRGVRPRAPGCSCTSTRTTRSAGSSTSRSSWPSPTSSSAAGARVFADEIHAPLVYPGARAPPVRLAVAGDGPAHRHGDLDVQGLERARA